jgi:hypothetical protein
MHIFGRVGESSVLILLAPKEVAVFHRTRKFEITVADHDGSLRKKCMPRWDVSLGQESVKQRPVNSERRSYSRSPFDYCEAIGNTDLSKNIIVNPTSVCKILPPWILPNRRDHDPYVCILATKGSIF